MARISSKNLTVLLSVILTLLCCFSITGYYEFLNLRRLKKNQESLIVKNSIIGLEILDQIDVFKRLAKNDLKLIEHIARHDLRMIGKDELILIPKNSQGQPSVEKSNENRQNSFRILTEDEFNELLSFDITLFKFQDELKDSSDSGLKRPNQER